MSCHIALAMMAKDTFRAGDVLSIRPWHIVRVSRTQFRQLIVTIHGSAA